jgi:hypothetical protein
MDYLLASSAIGDRRNALSARRSTGTGDCTASSKKRSPSSVREADSGRRKHRQRESAIAAFEFVLGRAPMRHRRKGQGARHVAERAGVTRLAGFDLERIANQRIQAVSCHVLLR